MTIVDRFEGEYAICEISEEGRGELFENIPRVLLPKDVREGDCLVRDSEGNWAVDHELTDRRRKAIEEKLRSLFNA